MNNLNELKRPILIIIEAIQDLTLLKPYTLLSSEAEIDNNEVLGYNPIWFCT